MGFAFAECTTPVALVIFIILRAAYGYNSDRSGSDRPPGSASVSSSSSHKLRRLLSREVTKSIATKTPASAIDGNAKNDTSHNAGA